MGVHWVELRRRVALATCAATPNNRETRARICLLGWCRAYHVAELRVSLVHGLVRGRQVGGRLEKGKQGLLHMYMCKQEIVSTGGWVGTVQGQHLAHLAGTAAQQEDQIDDLRLWHSKPAVTCAAAGALWSSRRPGSKAARCS